MYNEPDKKIDIDAGTIIVINTADIEDVDILSFEQPYAIVFVSDDDDSRTFFEGYPDSLQKWADMFAEAAAKYRQY